MSAEVAAPGVGGATQAPGTPGLDTELDGGPNTVSDAPSDDYGDFDVEELRAKAQKMLSGGRGGGEEGEEADDADEEEPKAKPKEKAKSSAKTEPKSTAKAEPKTEPKTPAGDDDQDLAARRKTLQDKEGKLDDEQVSNAFAKLHAQEKRFKARVSEHIASESAFKAEREAYQNERAAFEKDRDAWKSYAKRSPLHALEQAGWTWQQLTQYVSANGAIPPEKLVSDAQQASSESEKKLLARIDELEKRNSSFQDKFHADQYTARKTSELRTGLDAGAYPLIKDYMQRGVFTFEKLVERSMQNIANVWQNQQRQVDVKELLDYYEADLAEHRRVHGGVPAQAGAEKTAEDPEAVKPVTNDATAERTRRRSDDDGLWSEADAEEARKASRRILRGGG